MKTKGNSRRQIQIILLGLGLVISGIIAFPYLLDRALRAGSGPEHLFELSESLPFLTEDVALAKARETLVLDGLNIGEWQARPDDRTEAPDGRPDRFMARNSINSNRGTFMFTSGPKTPTRFVDVELNGKKIICQSTLVAPLTPVKIK